MTTSMSSLRVILYTEPSIQAAVNRGSPSLQVAPAAASLLLRRASQLRNSPLCYCFPARCQAVKFADNGCLKLAPCSGRRFLSTIMPVISPSSPLANKATNNPQHCNKEESTIMRLKHHEPRNRREPLVHAPAQYGVTIVGTVEKDRNPALEGSKAKRYYLTDEALLGGELVIQALLNDRQGWQSRPASGGSSYSPLKLPTFDGLVERVANAESLRYWRMRPQRLYSLGTPSTPAPIKNIIFMEEDGVVKAIKVALTSQLEEANVLSASDIAEALDLHDPNKLKVILLPLRPRVHPDDFPSQLDDEPQGTVRTVREVEFEVWKMPPELRVETVLAAARSLATTDGS